MLDHVNKYSLMVIPTIVGHIRNKNVTNVHWFAKTNTSRIKKVVTFVSADTEFHNKLVCP